MAIPHIALLITGRPRLPLPPKASHPVVIISAIMALSTSLVIVLLAWPAVAALRPAIMPRVRQERRMGVSKMAEEEPTIDDEPLPPSEAPAPEVIKPPPRGNEPTMPVSSMMDKVKGLAAIFVILIGVGFVMSYSFSPDSPFMSSSEPQVNQALQKYTTSLESAQ